MHEFTVQTARHDQMITITAEVEAAAAALGVRDGALLVHVPHTTAAVTVNEGADPDVTSDLLRRLEAVAP